MGRGSRMKEAQPARGDEARPNERSELWLSLLRRLTEEVPGWSTWKNVDSALAGTGDVDSLAPRSAWPSVSAVFLEWAAGRGFEDVIVCPHVPQGPHFITFEPGAPYNVPLDDQIRATFRGSTLVSAANVLPLTTLDPRGFRCMRPGADGVIRLVSNGILPGGRENAAALATKGVSRLLKRDPKGVELMAATFGPARDAVLAGAKAVVDGRWNRRAMLTVEAWALARSLAEPGVATSRIWFAQVAKKRCPVIGLIRESNRRVPADLPKWLDEVRNTHEVVSIARERLDRQV